MEPGKSVLITSPKDNKETFSSSGKLALISVFLFAVLFLGCIGSQNEPSPENSTTVKNTSITTCIDGTLNGQCSATKPLFCNNGTLIQSVQNCAPTENVSKVNETSCEDYMTEPKTITFLYYTPRTNYRNFFFTFYTGLNDYLESLPKSIYYNPATEPVPSERDFIIRDLNETCQRQALSPFISTIKNITSDSIEQVKIFIDIVQRLSYDFGNTTSPNPTNKYPYQVLYSQIGVCGDKSKLLAFFLRELGFGVALFDFSMDNHRAVGIKCSMDKSYHKTGYCFIESTVPTDLWIQGLFYFGVVGEENQLTSEPQVIPIADGMNFTG
jgi:hypothetical protein